MGLKPRKERPTADEIVNELRPKLSGIPGINVFMQVPPAIQIGARSAKSLYQYTLQSPDIEALDSAAKRMEARMRNIPQLQDVTSDLQIANPQVIVDIDRDRAASLGVNATQIESALYDAYGSRQVSTIYTPNNQYMVVMELLPQFQRDVDALRMLYVRSEKGDLVPLSAVANLTQNIGPLSITHSGQLPSVTISFNTRPGVALGQATAAVEAAAATTIPSAITTSFSGTAQAFQASQQGLLALLILAIFVIYMVLGILYESFIHPATILTGLPFAAFGALIALFIFRLPLDVYGFVGLILLVGIVKKNAIMMIDFALEAERTQHISPEKAIVQAATVRFRPIMMTTFAALMATLPIALGRGAGAEARRPLGVAVVGGLAFSQLVTLYVTPVFYTYFDELPGESARLHEEDLRENSRAPRTVTRAKQVTEKKKTSEKRTSFFSGPTPPPPTKHHQTPPPTKQSAYRPPPPLPAGNGKRRRRNQRKGVLPFFRSRPAPPLPHKTTTQPPPQINIFFCVAIFGPPPAPLSSPGITCPPPGPRCSR